MTFGAQEGKKREDPRRATFQIIKTTGGSRSRGVPTCSIDGGGVALYDRKKAVSGFGGGPRRLWINGSQGGQGIRVCGEGGKVIVETTGEKCRIFKTS